MKENPKDVKDTKNPNESALGYLHARFIQSFFFNKISPLGLWVEKTGSVNWYPNVRSDNFLKHPEMKWKMKWKEKKIKVEI